MLLQMDIENLAIIEKVSLSFEDGLNVLTGETGAGKSIIVDAMKLLVGGRSSTEQVRTGCDKASVTGLFDSGKEACIAKKLEQLGLSSSDDGLLLLSREIAREGRSICRINGRIVPLAIYRTVGEMLVDLHGQHEQQSLFKVDNHRELLDKFCGLEVLKLRGAVEDLYHKLVSLKAEREKSKMNERELLRRVEYLKHAVMEIDRFNPVAGEENELQLERERLRNIEKLASLVKDVMTDLADGERNMVPAYDLICRSADKVKEIARYDSSVADIFKVLEEVKYKLEDVLVFFRQYGEQLEFDPVRTQEVEERLYALKDLMRKYGASLEDVCLYRQQAAAELEQLERINIHREELDEQYGMILQEYRATSENLSALRKERARDFAAAVTEELKFLGMDHACFDFRWEFYGEPSPYGIDKLEFLFSPNIGEPLKPLVKIASGGEISRVMLALKVILARYDEIPTLIFDEIDSGIGGRTILAVSDRLSKVASSKQVLCVTHSPHIAGRAKRHYYIEKKVEGERTMTLVRLLEGQERVKEIARMLGGTIDNHVTRTHAEHILRGC